MTTFLIIVLGIWAIGAVSGAAYDFFVMQSHDAEDYAKEVFWPIFGSIWLVRGLMRALEKAVK